MRESNVLPNYCFYAFSSLKINIHIQKTQRGTMMLSRRMLAASMNDTISSRRESYKDKYWMFLRYFIVCFNRSVEREGYRRRASMPFHKKKKRKRKIEEDWWRGGKDNFMISTGWFGSVKQYCTHYNGSCNNKPFQNRIILSLFAISTNGSIRFAGYDFISSCWLA